MKNASVSRDLDLQFHAARHTELAVQPAPLCREITHRSTNSPPHSRKSWPQHASFQQVLLTRSEPELQNKGESVQQKVISQRWSTCIHNNSLPPSCRPSSPGARAIYGAGWSRYPSQPCYAAARDICQGVYKKTGKKGGGPKELSVQATGDTGHGIPGY